MGSVHETFDHGDRISQKLNPNFPVPDLGRVNKLVAILKKAGIEAAFILHQTAEERVMEKIEGSPTTFTYTKEQAVKAARFMARLHKALRLAQPLATFKPVSEFSNKKEQVIWGDLNGGNIIWRDGEPVGVVDYDTASLGDRWYDLASACVLWPEVFSLDYAVSIIQAYQEELPIATSDWDIRLSHFALLIHKKMVDAYFGRSHIKRPREYFEGRLEKLDRTLKILSGEIV